MFSLQNCADATPLSRGSIDHAKAPGAAYIAADPSSGLVFASCHDSDKCFPLAVVPATGPHGGFLLAGRLGTPDISVLALPTLELVHSGTLAPLAQAAAAPGRQLAIVSFAADRVGGAVAVADCNSGTVEVHTWPLPGCNLGVRRSATLPGRWKGDGGGADVETGARTHLAQQRSGDGGVQKACACVVS